MNGQINIANEFFNDLVGETLDDLGIHSDIYFSEATGFIKGGIISINIDPSKINVSAGSGHLVDYSDPSNIVRTEVVWPSFTGVSVGLNVFAVWVGIDFTIINAPVVTFFVSITPVVTRNIVVVGRIWSTTGNVNTNVTNFAPYTFPAYQIPTSFRDLCLAINSFCIEGNEITHHSGLLLKKSSGKSFRFWANQNLYGEENIHSGVALDPIVNYGYHLQNSNVLINRFSIDPNNYDLGGVLTPVPSSEFSIQEIWYYPVSQVIGIIYGQVCYTSLPAAITGLNTEKKARNTSILYGAILRCSIIVQQGSTSLADAVFFSEANFNESSVIGRRNLQYVSTSLSFADYGSANVNYVGGHYIASPTATTLTAGTSNFLGSSNVMYGSYVFAVTGSFTGTNTLSIRGTSINGKGVRIPLDTEVLVPITSGGATNSYYESAKRYVGEVEYILTGTGSYTFNRGFCAYDSLGKKHYRLTDVSISLKSSGAATTFDLSVLHHMKTGWVYSANAFVPGATTICSSLSDVGVESNLELEGYAFYRRTNLSEIIDGDNGEGVLIRISVVANNVLRYGTILLGTVY